MICTRYCVNQRDLSKCLKYLKANMDASVHITGYDNTDNKACLILTWYVYDDFKNQVLLVREYRKQNVCDRTMSFEKAKKEVIKMLFNKGGKI